MVLAWIILGAVLVVALVISIVRRRQDIVCNGRKCRYVWHGMHRCPVCKDLIPGTFIRPGRVVKRFMCSCFKGVFGKRSSELTREVTMEITGRRRQIKTPSQSHVPNGPKEHLREKETDRYGSLQIANTIKTFSLKQVAKAIVKKKLSNVYWDQLMRIFEDTIGLRTKLF
jgi:hypothetical protein